MAMLKKLIKNILPYFIVRKIQNNRNVKRGVSVILKTSLSDNEKYPNFCLNAANDLLVFSNFRRNEIYQQVLEHVDVEIGGLYLEKIIEIKPDLIHEMEKIKANDLYGNPILYDYKIVGKICPSTLRYSKVLADLLNYFDSLDGLRIAEIGVGYGGQCRIINAIAKPSEYTLVDIRPALLLAQTYLDGYILSSMMKYKTMNELKRKHMI